MLGGVPLPVADFFHILAVLGDILLVLHQLVVHALDEVRALVAQLGQVDDGVLHQVEAVNLVLHAHIEGGGDGALFLVAVNAQVAVGALVGQLVDEGGIAVESEDDGLILGEDGVVLGVAEAVGMLVVGLQLEQVHPR